MGSVQVTGQTETGRTKTNGHNDGAISLHEQMMNTVTDVVAMERYCHAAMYKAETENENSLDAANRERERAISAATQRELESRRLVASTVSYVEDILQGNGCSGPFANDNVAPMPDADPVTFLTDVRSYADEAEGGLRGCASTTRIFSNGCWLVQLIVWPLIPIYLLGLLINWLRKRYYRNLLFRLRTQAREVGAAWATDLDYLTRQVRSAADAEFRRKQDQAQRAYESAVSDIISNLNARISHIRGQIQQICNAFAASSWQDLRWKTWAPPLHAISSIRIGTIAVPTPSVHKLLPKEAEFCVPAMLQFAGGRGILVKDSGHREVVNNAIQSIMLRLLAMVPPGKLRFTFIDPVGLGQNVAAFMHLQDHDVVTGKAWTEPQHIDKCLAKVTEHMENVIQKYLRQEFETIEEYNEKAGEVTESYRVVVIFDFPNNFSEAAARRLVSIMRNGVRCGVYAFVVVDATKPMPYGFSLQDLEQFATVVSTEGQVLSLDLSLPRPETQPLVIEDPSPPPASQSPPSDSVVVPNPSPKAEPREPAVYEHPGHAQQQAVDQSAPQPDNGQTGFDIVLTSAGANVAAVREALQVLADRPEQISDDLAGFTLKGYRQEEAAEIKRILEGYGAVVELRRRGQ